MYIEILKMALNSLIFPPWCISYWNRVPASALMCMAMSRGLCNWHCHLYFLKKIRMLSEMCCAPSHEGEKEGGGKRPKILCICTEWMWRVSLTLCPAYPLGSRWWIHSTWTDKDMVAKRNVSANVGNRTQVGHGIYWTNPAGYQNSLMGKSVITAPFVVSWCSCITGWNTSPNFKSQGHYIECGNIIQLLIFQYGKWIIIISN